MTRNTLPVSRLVIRQIWSCESAKLAVAAFSTYPEFLAASPDQVSRWQISDAVKVLRQPLAIAEVNVQLTESERHFASAFLEALKDSKGIPRESRFWRFFRPPAFELLLCCRANAKTPSGEAADTRQASQGEHTPILPPDIVRELLTQLENIEQDSKFNACVQILRMAAAAQSRSVFFTNFRDTAEYVGDLASAEGLITAVMTGEALMTTRRNLLEGMGRDQVLVLTTAASQGLEIPFATTVIHYDVPATVAEFYVRASRIRTTELNRPTHYLLIDGITTTHEMLEQILRGSQNEVL
jgi:superfamily II DNA or RNA helicase